MEMEQTDKTEKYEALVMEVIAFERGDIIMTSGNNPGDIPGPIYGA